MVSENVSSINNTQEKGSTYQTPIGPIYEKFSRQKDVTFVYGEPIELDDKKVLPVAKVRYYVGGGGGYSEGATSPSAAHGGGGGGHFSVTPVGVYEITTKKVKYKPIINVQFITLFTICTLGICWVIKKRINARTSN